MPDLEVLRYQGPCTYTAAPTITVLVWNVNFRSVSDRVLARIEALNPSILLLQEVSMQYDLPRHIHELGYNGMFVECEHFAVPSMRVGNAIFSRFVVRDARYKELRVGHHPPWKMFGRSRRCYLEADLELFNGSQLTVGTVHLAYPLPFQRKLRLREQERLWQVVAERRRRFLFAGDFNLSPKTALVRALRGELQHLGPPLSEPTWPSNGLIRRFLKGRRLDYAFGTQDIHVIRADIADGRPSDHCQLLYHLVL